MRTASCACSQLNLKVTQEPQIVAICSCRQCQLRTGSVYSTHAFFPQSGVTIEGDSKSFTRSSDSGREVTFHFCPTCGSTVFWHAEARPDAVGIASGCFTGGPELPAPVAGVFIGDKADWVPLPPGMPTFDQAAPVPPPSSD